eukprot:jgi/Mesvir1/19835/Mv13125-RA.1
MIPLYTSRGGYGPADPDYLSAPGARPGMGRNTSLMKMHVEPPKDKQRRKTEFKKAEESNIWKKSRPGAEPTSKKPIVETQQIQGRFTPDRRRGYDNTIAAMGTRSHLLPNVKDNLIVNYMTPDPTFVIAKPNPQQAHVDQPKLSVHLDGLNRATRSGVMSSLGHMSEETNERMTENTFLETTVLPERAKVVEEQMPVYDGTRQNVKRWTEMQLHSRPDPKRAMVLDALEKHQAPEAKDFFIPLQLGARLGVNPVGPTNPRTIENDVRNTSYETMGVSVREDDYLHDSRMQFQESKIFEARASGADRQPEELLVGPDVLETTRSRSITSDQLAAVARPPADFSRNAITRNGLGLWAPKPAEARFEIADLQHSRVDELAGKVFTGYELQKLRTYIPNLRFTADEANLVTHNMYGDQDQNPNAGGLQPNGSLQTKLRNFIGSVYVYDILTSLMRDISERVRRAVDEGVLDTNRAEIGKLVNALRGFVAVEHDDGQAAPLAPVDLNVRVYLSRISPNVLAKIGALRPNYVVANTSGNGMTQAAITLEEGQGIYRVGPNGLMSGAGTSFPDKIQAITLAADNLPSYNTLVPPGVGGQGLGNFPSDDSIPSNLLKQLTQDTIDPTMLSMLHRKKMQALKLDDVVTPAGAIAGDRANTFWQGQAAAIPTNPNRAGLNNVMWRDAAGAADKGFPNIIQKFIRMDVLMFNRMRIMILNEIDKWWKNQGALSSISNLGAADPTKAMLRLMDADYRVSGVPTPQCGPGSSAVFYNRDPNGPRGYLARVVPPYIVAADGTMVENPEAIFGPFCQRRQGIPDLVSTYPTGGPGQSSNLISSHLMGAKKTRRKAAPKKKTTRRK